MAFDREGFYEEVGKLLRRTRDNRGFTQQELAREVGIPRSTYANMERGRQRPPADVLWRAAVVLGVSVDDLLPRLKTRIPEEEFQGSSPAYTLGQSVSRWTILTVDGFVGDT